MSSVDKLDKDISDHSHLSFLLKLVSNISFGAMILSFRSFSLFVLTSWSSFSSIRGSVNNSCLASQLRLSSTGDALSHQVRIATSDRASRRSCTHELSRTLIVHLMYYISPQLDIFITYHFTPFSTLKQFLLFRIFSLLPSPILFIYSYFILLKSLRLSFIHKNTHTNV